MKIKLPIILNATDYHEFGSYEDVLNQIIVQDSGKKSIAYQEIGYNNGYQAYFHDKSHKPTPEDIVCLVLQDLKGQFKNPLEVAEHLDWLNCLNQVDLAELIDQMEQTEPFYKTAKRKAKIK